MTRARPIREILTQGNLQLTPSEARIAQVLLTDYPIAGLATAASLAKRAGVSDPTVIRLVTKLGFDGFPAFQARLLEEVEAGLRSPLMMMEARRPTSTDTHLVEAYIRSASATVDAVAGMTLPQIYDQAVALIMEARGRVFMLGGRFSRHVAAMLAGYVAQFRPNVHAVGPVTAESYDLVLDIDKRDTVVVFDYRRYQTDVVRFSQQAAARGAQIVLFTDPWRSPLADVAKAVIVAPVEVNSPYDSLAPVVAQMEALVALIVSRESRAREARVQDLEKIRKGNNVTLETRADAPAAPRRKPASRKRKDA